MNKLLNFMIMQFSNNYNYKIIVFPSGGVREVDRTAKKGQPQLWTLDKKQQRFPQKYSTK